jgi:hypothetical protein
VESLKTVVLLKVASVVAHGDDGGCVPLFWTEDGSDGVSGEGTPNHNPNKHFFPCRY